MAKLMVGFGQKYGKEPAPDWFIAFQQLTVLLESSKRAKKIVFLDELPWLDTAQSNFISALEHFWNSWASARNDIKLVVCGSAAGWMINKLINNRGACIIELPTASNWSHSL